VCGTKNFVSVRLYSAPQSHWTIVAILRICAYGEPVQAEFVRHNQTGPVPFGRAKAAREGLATNAAAKRSSFPIELSRQVSQHGLAGFFGLSERFKGRAADFDGAAALMDRTPRRHEASASVKAGTVAALMTDHEGKAVAARAPYFQVLDETNDAGELHSRQIALWVGI
jgi:hypothetical protein